MSQNQSQNVQVTLTVPEEFYRLMEKMTKSYAESIEEYVLDQAICGLVLDLQDLASTVLGFGKRIDYEDQPRAVVAGGAA